MKRPNLTRMMRDYDKVKPFPVWVRVLIIGGILLLILLKVIRVL